MDNGDKFYPYNSQVNNALILIDNKNYPLIYPQSLCVDNCVDFFYAQDSQNNRLQPLSYIFIIICMFGYDRAMSTYTKPILKSLAKEITPVAPVWLMRQAGRYLPEYRALRSEAGSFLKLCFNPEFACEVTLQPIRRFGMDAAILFSDILVIPYALGQSLDFVEGEGPQLGAFDFDTLSTDKLHDVLAPVYETVRLVRESLPQDKTLIGFAGSPWTIACYMLQGHGKSQFEKAFAFAKEHPETFDRLLDMIADATASYLIRQIESGADTVQLFDSWAGLCTDRDFYLRAVILPTRKIIDKVKAAHPDTPIIGFPLGSKSFYGDYAAQTGVDAIGVDHHMNLADVPSNICIQGNLSPEVLLEGGDKMKAEALRILEETKNRPFIFNLGHGVIKETPPEHVAELMSIIKGYKRA